MRRQWWWWWRREVKMVEGCQEGRINDSINKWLRSRVLGNEVVIPRFLACWAGEGQYILLKQEIMNFTGKDKDWTQEVNDRPGWIFSFLRITFHMPYTFLVYIQQLLAHPCIYPFSKHLFITCNAWDSVLDLEYFNEQIKDPYPCGPYTFSYCVPITGIEPGSPR